MSEAPVVNDKFAAPTVPSNAWVSSPRSYLYAVVFFLVGALSLAEIGLVSQQLQNGGNLVTRYPSAEWKHIIGLLLFNGIFSLLLALASKVAPFYVAGFFLFCTSTIWATGAGIANQVSPFRAGNCSNVFAAPYDRFVDQCSRFVAIEALAWLLWILTLGLCVSIVLEATLRKEKHFGSFYGA